MVQKSGKLTTWGWLVYPTIYRILYIQNGGWPWDFWTINSILHVVWTFFFTRWSVLFLKYCVAGTYLSSILGLQPSKPRPKLQSKQGLFGFQVNLSTYIYIFLAGCWKIQSLLVFSKSLTITVKKGAKNGAKSQSRSHLVFRCWFKKPLVFKTAGESLLMVRWCGFICWCVV